ncbi:MAG: hypothetical protein US25_C0006G0009 [Candidatus Moranbacteria bacterium GW2011_GWE1_36_7]|nr:MAG: hypothetical protein UR99_C0002G0016 [Candidatus Moranbacteria bacterium GW2011_GWD2_36_12]KKQ07041.1 MAG: hypothetical protein US16_C0003G0016 [Candidatus Moranbacteria bacterium GW2011_GWE2_36_40]KKQ15381.1 MAG: hypothetical protein US25_C0006G0009 [Candidatus Moranbacteria bacterium GW2011_GWE1_36_7]
MEILECQNLRAKPFVIPGEDPESSPSLSQYNLLFQEM